MSSRPSRGFSSDLTQGCMSLELWIDFRIVETFMIHDKYSEIMLLELGTTRPFLRGVELFMGHEPIS